MCLKTYSFTEMYVNVLCVCECVCVHAGVCVSTSVCVLTLSMLSTLVSSLVVTEWSFNKSIPYREPSSKSMIVAS